MDAAIAKPPDLGAKIPNLPTEYREGLWPQVVHFGHAEGHAADQEDDSKRRSAHDGRPRRSW
jgi:hypothetical protein